MDPAVVAEKKRVGIRHLHFVISLYRIQVDAGRHFLHEHPAGARSWSEPLMASMLKDPRVGTVTSDQCMFGLTTPGPDGPMLAKKPTRVASSPQPMLDRLSRKCDRSHEHQHLMGGRAAAAAYYPIDLVNNILRGMRDTADSEWVDECKDDKVLAQSSMTAGLVHDASIYSVASTMEEQNVDDANTLCLPLSI